MVEAGNSLLAEVMLWMMYIVAVVAVVVTVVSAVRPLMIAPRKNSGNRGWLVVAFTVVMLLVAYLLGSDSPLVVNGKVYADAFWLKATDMLIISSTVLIVVAAALVVFGLSGLSRKRFKR